MQTRGVFVKQNQQLKELLGRLNKEQGTLNSKLVSRKFKKAYIRQ